MLSEDDGLRRLPVIVIVIVIVVVAILFMWLISCISSSFIIRIVITPNLPTNIAGL